MTLLWTLLDQEIPAGQQSWLDKGLPDVSKGTLSQKGDLTDKICRANNTAMRTGTGEWPIHFIIAARVKISEIGPHCTLGNGPRYICCQHALVIIRRVVYLVIGTILGMLSMECSIHITIESVLISSHTRLNIIESCLSQGHGWTISVELSAGNFQKLAPKQNSVETEGRYRIICRPTLTKYRWPAIVHKWVTMLTKPGTSKLSLGFRPRLVAWPYSAASRILRRVYK
ncbi:hypothetical protein J6590_033858 [Homalodisca vitripennis]|nr:hypothetical protein J6590_033858 [Homalodisca vitripennis]